jgi:UDP-2,4-diacetamido-2,4,6-trideoxy-beta-L-altropyranose hydrolase
VSEFTAFTLLLRADASVKMGTGHVMRCLAMAQAWQDAGGKVVFVMATESSVIEDNLKIEGIKIYHLSAIPGSNDDAYQTIDLAEKENANFVVVDGYHFDSRYQLLIKSSGKYMLVIDDYGHADRYYADLVLNQNIYANEGLYKKREHYTCLLLGTSYVLMRKEFWPYRILRREAPHIAHKVMVTLGGSDPHNVTLKIINSLQYLTLSEMEVVVVAGGGNTHNLALDAASKNSAIPLKLVRNAANMPELMAWADMAIVSGGTTSYETAFMGLPSLITIIADNQVLVAEKLAEAGAAMNLGWHHKLNGTNTAKMVTKLAINRNSRDCMSRIGQQLVDGRGTNRVIRAILDRIILVRVAVEGDCHQIYKWANDNDTRAASFNSSFIDWDTHCHWFSQKHQNPNCVLLICSDDKRNSLGLVRFDLAGDEAIISINLDPNMRGRGLAGFIIIRTLDELHKRYHISKVSAFIKQQNLRSAKVFERAGFSEIGSTTIRGHEAKHYVINNEELIRR